ncbi:DUF948 domain-containing protein [Marinilactibacillus psychrotolerans]|uniref:DUF948 domain-containing protein n=1 Tax=Marinilactibacillus psychrotolerans TaxID=191770 RepID=A0AAV3WUD5_9LACT|nr:DUF948 domain-containing protein [Marinilactibacillus psychrotolerans]GEL66510.1 hypothetical protein MPS01_06650 [Marinilactibacillus psychrotolerans]GEQ35326.1 hypothetical protein M132T_08340 [Marinilactibacillus psychrotolerans]SDC51931.1 Uncharacterized protein YoxC, contains an MCP-like domain [Marinilactibacillus psychrotolerans]
MSLGYIIALIILGIALIALIAIGIITFKKVKPTLKNFKETQNIVQDHIEHFTGEADAVQTKVNKIMERVEDLQKVSNIKMQRFNELSTHASSLNNSLTYLKEHSGDYSKGIAQNAVDELKTEGPIIAKTFNLAFKRTIEKQKARYKTN